MASKLNPKSLMTVMTMTVMTTFNKNWALRANRGVIVLIALFFSEIVWQKFV